jgi:hypothetical protein
MDHFLAACDEKYINEELLANKEDEINRCLQVLNGYINYLEKMNKAKKE